MSEAFRHHHARREIVLVPVPVPFEGGSPKEAHRHHPGPYKRNSREPWKPANAIPRRVGKAEQLARFFDYMRRQDEIVREFMKPDARLLKAWLAGGNV